MEEEEEVKEEQADTKPSKLAAALLSKWAWGSMSAPVVQALAAAAWEDGLAHDEVAKLARIGGGGKFPGNMHRDLMALTTPHNPLQPALSNYHIPVKPKRLPEEISLQFLLPHKLFATLFEALPDAFTSSLLGGDAANISNFWKAMKKHPMVTSRPDL